MRGSGHPMAKPRTAVPSDLIDTPLTATHISAQRRLRGAVTWSARRPLRASAFATAGR
jgi:hypothetical protein